MVTVSVKKQEDGTYDVKIGSHTITLPKDSVAKEKANDKMTYGKGSTRVEYDGHIYTVTFVKKGKKQVVVDGEEDFDTAEQAATDLTEEWRNAQRGGAHRTRRRRIGRGTRKTRGRK